MECLRGIQSEHDFYHRPMGVENEGQAGMLGGDRVLDMISVLVPEVPKMRD